MRKIRPIKRAGLTIIELMTASVMGITCLLAVGVVVYDSQKAWNETYTKANSAIMLDSHLASKAFVATVRKASCEKYLLDPPDIYGKSRWVEVYYFASDSSSTTDRYAKFYIESGTFYIEHGIFNPRQILHTITICSNVTDFNFSGSGRCIRMDMTLSNNDEDVSFFCSAIPQNQ